MLLKHSQSNKNRQSPNKILLVTITNDAIHSFDFLVFGIYGKRIQRLVDTTLNELHVQRLNSGFTVSGKVEVPVTVNLCLTLNSSREQFSTTNVLCNAISSYKNNVRDAIRSDSQSLSIACRLKGISTSQLFASNRFIGIVFCEGNLLSRGIVSKCTFTSRRSLSPNVRISAIVFNAINISYLVASITNSGELGFGSTVSCYFDRRIIISDFLRTSRDFSTILNCQNFGIPSRYRDVKGRSTRVRKATADVNVLCIYTYSLNMYCINALIVSYESRSYHQPRHTLGCSPLHNRLIVTLCHKMTVEPYSNIEFWLLIIYFYQYLGLHHIPSVLFFQLSQHSHLLFLTMLQLIRH